MVLGVWIRGGIDNGALLQHLPLVGEVLGNGGKHGMGQLMLFLQMAEVQQGGLVQGEAGELAHGGDLVQAFFHGRI